MATGAKNRGRFYVENVSKDFLVPFGEFDIEKETTELVDRLNFVTDRNSGMQVGDEIIVRDQGQTDGVEKSSIDAKFDSNGNYSSPPTSFLFTVGQESGFFSRIGIEPESTGTVDVRVEDSQSNVLASETGVSVTDNELTVVEFSESDYSRLVQNEDITIVVTDIGVFQNDESVDPKFFDTASDPGSVPRRNIAEKGVGIEFTATGQPLKIFGGYISKKEQRQQNWRLEADEYIVETVDKVVKRVFKNKTPEEILSTLIEEETNLSFFAPVSSGVTLDKYVIEGPIEDAIDDMTKLLDWQLRTTPQKEVYLEPIGRISSGQTLTHGENTVVETKTTKDNQFINSVELRAGRTEYQRAETFSGDSSTTIFDLQEIPVGNVDVVVDGVTKQGAISEDLRSGDDFYIDKENRQLIFDSAPASGTDNIQIDYSYEVPVLVNAQASNAQIPPSERVINTQIKREWLRTFDDARQYAKEYVSNHAKLIGSAKAVVPFGQDPKIGYLAEVNDSRKDINESLVVESKKIDSTGQVEMKLGQQDYNSIEWRYNVTKRLRQIQQKQATEKTFTEFVAVENELNVNFTYDITIKKREINDSFILGNSDNGVLGEDKLGDRRGSKTTVTTTTGQDNQA